MLFHLDNIYAYIYIYIFMNICISNCMEVFVIPCEGLNDNGAAYQRGGNVNCDKL